VATVQIKGFVHHSKSYGEGKDEFSFFTFDATGSSMGSSMGYTMVAPHEFTYELPADFSPTASEIAALNAKRAKAAKEFADTVRAIDERLSKLRAIEHSEAA